MRRGAAILGALATCCLVAGAFWVASLPRLYRDGVRPDDLGLLAMIRGEPVFDVSTWRVLTRKDYERAEEKR